MNTNRGRPDQYMLRLPEGMREALKVRAAANGRSMATEIVTMIEAGLAGLALDDQRLARIEAKLDEALAR